MVATFTSSDTNYTSGGSAQATFAINPAAPTLSVSDPSGTYNGQPFPATATAVGLDGKTPVAGSFSFAYYAGANATGTPQSNVPVNAGTYTVVATFTSNDPNYTSGGTAQTTFTIRPAAPTLSVTDAGGIYNGNPFPATAAALGVDGKTPVNGSFTFAYYTGTSASGTPLSGPPVNVGTYTVVASFTSNDRSYTSGGTAQTTFTISQATLTGTGTSVKAIADAPSPACWRPSPAPSPWGLPPTSLPPSHGATAARPAVSSALAAAPSRSTVLIPTPPRVLTPFR